MAAMAPKLIFLDIDGTLTLPGESTPPPTALAAIRAAQAAGHKVAICSGRNLGMLAALLPYGFDAVIASAGGLVQVGSRTLFDCPMTPAQFALARAAFAGTGLACTLECRDTSFADEGFLSLAQIARNAPPGTASSELERWHRQTVDALGLQPMAAYDGRPVYKVSFAGPGAHPLDGPAFDALRREFNLILHDPGTFGAFSGEIINRAFNKGTAVRLLAQHLGIPLADTVAFGDSMNDLEMIEAAGLGICMGNGTAPLKAAADEVCGRVEEDGLARAFAAHGLA